MERTHLIQRLTERRIDQVYPLVLLARPHFTLETWQRFCATRIGDDGAEARLRSGVLLAINKAGYVRGLCSYKVGGSDRLRDVLSIDILAFAHLFHSGEVLDRMLDEAEAIGMSAGCRVIEIADQDLGEWLDRAGKGRKLAISLLRKVQ